MDNERREEIEYELREEEHRIEQEGSLPIIPFKEGLNDKQLYTKEPYKFGFRCEVSRTPEFTASSYHISDSEELANEWITDTKNFEESHFKVKLYSRLTEIDIEYCEMCKRSGKKTPIEKGERFCLRCEDLMNEAREIEAEEYDKDEFGD